LSFKALDGNITVHLHSLRHTETLLFLKKTNKNTQAYIKVSLLYHKQEYLTCQVACNNNLQAHKKYG